MSKQPQNRMGRAVIGMIAAYALILQAFFASFALAQTSGGHSSSDALGILCTAASPAPEAPSAPSAPATHLISCCLICHFAGSCAVPPPQVLFGPVPAVGTVIAAIPPADHEITRGPVRNGLSRAPPRLM